MATPLPTSSSAPPITETPTHLPGDLNGDGTVDIRDIQLCINVILGMGADPTIISRADLNLDSMVDVRDLQILTNLILQG